MHPPISAGMARSTDSGSAVLLTPSPHSTAYYAISSTRVEAEPKRRSWGDRWRLGKSSKTDETMEVHSQFMVHPEYARKYGTISPGVLARSVKYGETWLYGTVAVRGSQAQRPSLFLYPGIAPQPTLEPRPPRFIPAQQRPRGICQCESTPRGAVCRQCGVRRSRPSRPSLLAATPQEEPKVSASTADPYSLMRKSRLGMGETTETSIINPKTKKRTRSSSPVSRNESSSFETFKPPAESTWVPEINEWESGSEDDTPTRRRSILEYDVSPYDLNRKCESDDELSDGTLEVNAKLKILRPKLKKTDVRNKRISIPEPKKLSDVRLSGQRFRIFEHSNSSTQVEGYVSDREEETSQELPKRPPRRPKNGLKLTKLKSTSSPNLSIKSILKKPLEDVSDSSVNESPPDTAESGIVLDFKWKKQTQSTLKKKKQVQFREAENGPSTLTEEAVPEEVEETQAPDDLLPHSLDDVMPAVEGDESQVISVNEMTEDNGTGNEMPEEDVPEPMVADKAGGDFALQSVGHDAEERPSVGTLKRSLSDRRPSSAIVKCGGEVLQMSTSPPNSFLFIDTMALRPRATRHDTRELFLDQLDDGLRTGRPKDPPPPPPPSKVSNLMSYADFSRLLDEANNKSVAENLPPPDPPPRISTPITKPSKRGDPPRLTLDKLSPAVKMCDHCENGLGGKEGKTVVNIGDELQEHGKKTSIIINGVGDGGSQGKRTSVIINNFPPEDCNKVTINVRNGENESPSCSTIIETGTSSTYIPIVSSDNKTTLVVGESMAQVAETPIPYLFSSTTLLDNIDPVDAVKRNLVPHVCGKVDDVPSLVERIGETRAHNMRLSKVFAAKNKDGVLTHHESLILAYQARKLAQTKNPETSTPNSRSSSFSIKSSRNTSRSNSFNESSSNSFPPVEISQSTFYVASDSDDTASQELDKLDDEYMTSGCLKEKKENIYETISEPIYDQVGFKLGAEEYDDDVPPPLPTTLPPSLEELENRASKSIFEGASKYDILSYLVDAKDRVEEDLYMDRPEGDSLLSVHRRMESLDGSEISTGKASDSGVDAGPASTSSDSSEDRDLNGALRLGRKSSAEIERNDSGVGSETSQSSRSKWQTSSACLREDPLHLCEDCDQTVETQVTDSGVMYAPLICRKCSKKRSERKEIIQEITETEEKYGRDLRIILEEFYKPMLVAGLLTPDQLAAIFLNVEELMDNSEALTEKLRDSLEIAAEQGDEDYLTVNIGRLFLDTKPMLHAFESYCTRQASAAVLLSSLEKEKELLRIFLKVSQMENAVLRRMNLNSFLMVPVQRVTKYPLLLARLYKVTSLQLEHRELLKEAQHSIELHLEHMNAEARDGAGARVWRRFSTTAVRKTTAELELTSIKIRKLAIDLLEWSHDEVRFVLEGRVLFAQPDGNWRRGRTVKLQPVFGLLATLGKPNSKYRAESVDTALAFPTKTGIREASLLLIKEKCGRFTLIREPLYLDKLIICCEAETEEMLEVQELTTKETFLLKAEDVERTKEWQRQLQYHAQILGGWRKRRNALANIMITGISYAS